MRVVLIILLVLILGLPLYARGIPLDSVYISTSSAEYQKLFFTRLDYYQSIGAQFIDSGIAYAGWLNGKEVVYIKESGNTNTVIINTVATRKKNTVYQFNGTVISARVSANGAYIAIKYFSNDTIPQPVLLLIHIPKKTIKVVKTASAGTDYSFSRDGNSLLYKNNNCIVEVMGDSYREKEILCRESAPQWDENTVILDCSSQRLFISGSSGNYDVYMHTNHVWKKLFTTITPAEVFIANNTAFYTAGFPGGYTVSQYSLQSGKTQRILSGSFNPSLYMIGNTAIFLNNAFITLYDSSKNKLLPTTIESDEAIVSPDLFSIASTLYNRLFILPTVNILALDPQSKRYLATVESHYTHISQKKSIYTSPYSSTYIQQKKKTIASLLTLF
ncbi:MAG: hypothetical protein QHH74_03435 [Spirochaetota bacterium]|nr:hypothetical protein [Spirochaetota bacterium]